MNILNTIMSKILPSAAKAQPASAQTTTAAPSPLKPSTTVAQPPMAEVDVEEILKGLEGKTAQKLDWRHSIVDLMKILGMDSDIESRKQLAKELNYTGDMNDSAKMNIWLHAQVMKKLEENGGKIPDAMKH